MPSCPVESSRRDELLSLIGRSRLEKKISLSAFSVGSSEQSERARDKKTIHAIREIRVGAPGRPNLCVF